MIKKILLTVGVLSTLVTSNAMNFTRASGPDIPDIKVERPQPRPMDPKSKGEGAVMKRAGFPANVRKIFKADGQSTLEGIWTFVFEDILMPEASWEVITTEYKCVYEPQYDDYYFECPSKEFLPFFVIFDPETNEINLPFTLLGYNDQHLIFQGGWAMDLEAMKFVFPKDFYLQFDPETKSIIIDKDCGICWSAYDIQFYEYLGDYDWQKFQSARITGELEKEEEEEDDSADWTYIGDATFMDGWILPSYGIDQTNPSNQYEVPLERNNENPNLYRLTGPYHRGPVAYVNESKVTGHIEFDVSNPEYVVFNMVSAGYKNSSKGIIMFYCLNTLGNLILHAGDAATVDQIIDAVGFMIPHTTFRDGIVTLGRIENPDGTFTYDANFGIQGDTEGGNVWFDTSRNIRDMRASIRFPDDYASVETIIGDNNGICESEYYNLQGIRLKEPRKGELVIEKKGKQIRVVKY